MRGIIDSYISRRQGFDITTFHIDCQQYADLWKSIMIRELITKEKTPNLCEFNIACSEPRRIHNVLEEFIGLNTTISGIGQRNIQMSEYNINKDIQVLGLEQAKIMIGLSILFRTEKCSNKTTKCR